MNRDDFRCKAFLAVLPAVHARAAQNGGLRDQVATECGYAADAAAEEAERRGMLARDAGSKADVKSAPPVAPMGSGADRLEPGCGASSGERGFSPVCTAHHRGEHLATGLSGCVYRRWPIETHNAEPVSLAEGFERAEDALRRTRGAPSPAEQSAGEDWTMGPDGRASEAFRQIVLDVARLIVCAEIDPATPVQMADRILRRLVHEHDIAPRAARPIAAPGRDTPYDRIVAANLACGSAGFDAAEPAEGWETFSRSRATAPAIDPVDAAMQRIGDAVSEIEGVMRDTYRRPGASPHASPLNHGAPVAPGREELGRAAHEEWLKVYRPNGGGEPWDSLSEDVRECEWRIGERLFAMGVQHARQSARTGDTIDATGADPIVARDAMIETLQRDLDSARLEAADWVSRFEQQGAKLREVENRHAATVLRVKMRDLQAHRHAIPRLISIAQGPPHDLAFDVKNAINGALNDGDVNAWDLGVHIVDIVDAFLQRSGTAAQLVRFVPRLMPVTTGPVAQLVERIGDVFCEAMSEPSDGELRSMGYAMRVAKLVDEHLQSVAAS